VGCPPKGEAEFQRELADALLEASNVAVKPFLAAAVAWLQQRREVLSNSTQAGGQRYFNLRDMLADLTYTANENNNEPEQSEEDLVNASLSAPGGKLAWILYGNLVAREPNQGCGFDRELGRRFTRVADAEGKPGLLARVFLAQHLDTLDWVDPAGAAEKLVPRFALTDPDAAALWQPALSVRSVLLGSSTRSSLHFCKFSRERISRYMSRRGRRGLWDTCCKRRYGTGGMKAGTI
jgi:hypothetical protein